MFDLGLGPRYTRQSDAILAQKAKIAQKRSSSVKFTSNTLIQKINIIKGLVDTYFKDTKDDYLLINSEELLTNYIEQSIKEGICAIDTETTGLDPIMDNIAGFSIYTPGLKSGYVPINHISYMTGQLLKNQISIDFIKEQFQRLIDHNVKFVFHNAKFDIRVIKNHIGLVLPAYWDTMVGAMILNENEPHGLKPLWDKYCSDTDQVSGDYETLFKGLPFTYVPPMIGYFYASADTKKTFDLYLFQKQFLDPEDCNFNKERYSGLSNIFRNVDMPMVDVLAEVEENGVCINEEFAIKLSDEYTQKLEGIKQKFQNICESYKDKIDSFRFAHQKSIKLSNPINIASPTQVAVLLYDILEIPPVNKKKPRDTGEDVLKELNLPITDVILEYRGAAKLLSTYINKLPAEVKPKTGRLHGRFSLTTAVTGRLASSDPNLQNIPSRKGKEIRKMFIPSPGGFVFISGDYSQQEPRILAQVSGDEHLIRAYMEGKDVYAWIASVAFNKPYEECLEFRPDGTVNKEGKERRAQIKAIVLGIMYSKGVDAIAQDLGITKKRAQEIYDTFFTAFPKVKLFVDQTQQKARDYGYVETLGGRKRRLPDMQLPKYEFSLIGNAPTNFNPLFDDDDDDSEVSFEVSPTDINYYTQKLNRAYGFQKMKIKEEARDKGILIKDNTMKIADAERQCVNAVIQGSAAVITKLAMIMIHKDKELRDLGYRTLLTVHDEINGECPYENRELVKQRVCKLMIDAAAQICSIPMKVDPCVEVAWSLECDDKFVNSLKEAYEKSKSIDQVSKDFYIDPVLVDKILNNKD